MHSQRVCVCPRHFTPHESKSACCLHPPPPVIGTRESYTYACWPPRDCLPSPTFHGEIRRLVRSVGVGQRREAKWDCPIFVLLQTRAERQVLPLSYVGTNDYIQQSGAPTELRCTYSPHRALRNNAAVDRLSRRVMPHMPQPPVRHSRSSFPPFPSSKIAERSRENRIFLPDVGSHPVSAREQFNSPKPQTHTHPLTRHLAPLLLAGPFSPRRVIPGGFVEMGVSSHK